MGDIGRPLIPGLPSELGILCLAKLPIDAVARSRAVSRTWALVLRKYPQGRLPQALACFCRGNEEESFMTWLFLSRSDLRSHVIPNYYSKSDGINIFTSSIQVIATGTQLLLVRAGLRFGATEGEEEGCSKQGSTGGLSSRETAERDEDGDVSSLQRPGNLLQGFDVWQMRWLRPRESPWGPMHVDRWQFATAFLGRHVYFAGGDSPATAMTAERLSLDTWTWETLPQMHTERSFYPSGFAMGGHFFVVGGEPHSSSTALPQSGEFYDPTTNMWTLVLDLWPHELWWASGGPQSIAVVKDVAYAIDEQSQAVLQLKLDDISHGVKWQLVGHLPRMDLHMGSGFAMHRLVSVGENELWAIFNGRYDHWTVFACRPHLAKEGLQWEHLPFVVPPSTQVTVSSGMGITV